MLFEKIKIVDINGNLILKLFFHPNDFDFDNLDLPAGLSINLCLSIEQVNYDDINITTIKSYRLKTTFSFDTKP